MSRATQEGPRPDAAAVGRARGLYDPAGERDACGVGFVARLDGRADHGLVRDAVQVLVNLEHRGARGGDAATGDGAGLLLGLPHAFFAQAAREAGFALPEPGEYAVGMLFLPTDGDLQQRCLAVFERAVEEEGLRVLGWRTVPTCADHLGDLARSTRPAVHQVFVGRRGADAGDLERRLYVARRVAEKEVAGWTAADAPRFYVASLSSRTVVYKGMLTGSQLERFYPDLAAPVFAAPFAVIHQRYSTNTLPAWHLAQPMRMLAHNGEINTLRGNINHMRAREADLESEAFGADLAKVLPAVVEGGSDSAVFDNVLELLVRAGRSLPHAAMMMVPEAWGDAFTMGADKRAFYEYHAAVMEPWDGPAALVFSDGRYIGATLDRNGLRPCRYTVTRDGYVVLASETGVLALAPGRILRLGRLQPGRMLLVDMEQGRIVPDPEIKGKMARRRPYRRWVKDSRIELRGLLGPADLPAEDPDALRARQRAFGYTEEELRMVLGPMASRGQEAVGSMGNDAALAVLSGRDESLFAYFKQLFAQVTNPPIDPLREALVMSLMNFAGPERNLLAETPEHCRRLKLHHPILTPVDMARLRSSRHPDVVARDLDILFPADGDGPALERALADVVARAEDAVADGATLLVLTDRGADAERAAIPALLATAGLHHHLIRAGRQGRASILVETGEAREVMHLALLVGYGASGVCPHLAMATVVAMAEEGRLDQDLAPETAVDNYITALKKGLLKTFSRMGISTIRSYCGAQIFEAVGLAPEVVEAYFTGTASRIGGVGLEGIARETTRRHGRGFGPDAPRGRLLDAGGDYHVRVGGARHLWTPEAVQHLQHAVRTDDYEAYRAYARRINDQSADRVTLRSLFRFKEAEPVPMDEVEPVEAIVKRFTTSAMSFGSLSKECHETIAVAMNRLGATSNCGEGGEDADRAVPLAGGDSRRSAVRQVASGRFGVTTEYLAGADELQIKMAQGAKPGEGGQLPGHKVSPEIARVRHTTPGVTLISPPPHHDIYSIEDLAQLIYDLKTVNPRARVSVKLVSEIGVGTVAAGVAKGGADMVLVSGHDGGTGASPLTSIKHAGLPWELGLAETQQALVANRLRDRIRVQTDGQLRTGRDLAVAALLGAEEFGFGTPVLVCLGCVMARKCHMNTCPVGVATQDPRLRERFRGRPEHVERFMRFIAEDLREVMASLGFRTVDEMVGRADRLVVEPAVEHFKARGLDFGPLLAPAEPDERGARRASGAAAAVVAENHPAGADETDERFDDHLIEPCRPALERGEPVHLAMPVRNVHRAVGARLSGEIVRRHGPDGLPEDTIRLDLAGTAGQSLGAFLAPGVAITVTGDANDYLAKGMSGGRIVLKPSPGARLQPHENVIVGNVVLYGATGGEVYVGGLAGERFAVRNSGATAVVEGVGDHACEYMTGGVVVVLGPTGYNFAAGMSGGIAYVWDASEQFGTRCNLDMVDLESVWTREDRSRLRALVERHAAATGSPVARGILDDWQARSALFVKVMPIEYRRVLARMRMRADRDAETVSATEEVYHG